MTVSELGIPLSQLIDAWLQACHVDGQYPEKDGWTPEEIITDFYQWLQDDVEDYEMPESGTWLCIKTAIHANHDQVFTEGKLYDGTLSLSIDESPAIAFTDDMGHYHLATGTWLHAHFKLQPVIEGEAKDVSSYASLTLSAEDDYNRRYIDRLRSESAWGFLAAKSLMEDEHGDNRAQDDNSKTID